MYHECKAFDAQKYDHKYPTIMSTGGAIIPKAKRIDIVMNFYLVDRSCHISAYEVVSDKNVAYGIENNYMRTKHYIIEALYHELTHIEQFLELVQTGNLGKHLKDLNAKEKEDENTS